MPLVLLFVLLALLNPQAVAQQASDHANAGISLAKAGKYAQAEQELLQAVQAAPTVPLYHAQLGSILGLQGKWNEAVDNFEKAVELDPENMNYRREAAAVEWQLGLMPRAEQNLNYVLSQQAGDPGATLLLGMVKERTGDYATAAQLLDSQFDLAMTQPDRAVALFDSIIRSGQKEKLPRLLDGLKAQASDQKWTPAIVRCTQIAVLGDDLATAQSLLASLSNNSPARPSAAVAVARLLYSRGDTAKAKELLIPLSMIANEELQTLLGDCFASEHQPTLAMQAYQKAIELNPSRVNSYESPISFMMELGRISDALTLVNRVLAIAPEDARPWLWKGNVALRAHSYSEAIESYRHAGKLDNANPESFLGVAAVHYVSGQTDAAIAEYKQGIARFPNEPRLYVAYASILASSPDALYLQAEAEKLLRKAVTLDPKSAEAHYQLGQMALQKNQLNDAQQELTRSVQSDSNSSKVHYSLSVVYRRMGRADDAAREFALYQDLKRAEENGSNSAMGAAIQP